MKLSFRLIQQRPIDVFHRCRFEIEKFDGCLHRFSDRREEDQSQAVLARQWRDFQFRRKNPGERSFTARENVGKIVRRAKESFDPVAWPPFYKARRPTFRHLGARCSDNLLNRRALRIERFMSRADFFDTTVSHYNLKRNDVIGCRSVNRASRTRGIVGDHASECRARARCHIRAETKSVWL